MKKIIGWVLITVIMFSMVACNNNSGEMTADKLNIVCANFPEYDWVRNLIKGSEDVDVWLLVDDGTDIHSFQPSVEDMVKVSDCDMFIYAGSESTNWMEDLLANAENEDITIINMVEAPCVEVLCEEEHDHEKEHDYDEHVWLSLNNAQNICQYIGEGIVKLDPEHAALYEANFESYRAKLSELDDAYKMAVESGNGEGIVFADRFPFKYLMTEYDLEYYAAFPGCTTETDASFQTIIALAEKVDELKLKNIIVIENSSTDVAQSVIDNTELKNAGVVTMNSMQSVTAEDIDSGATYLNIMEENLESLSKALETIEE